MADEIQDITSSEVKTFQNVVENLSELLTNSVNIVDKYYEIFFDPTPHYVELEQYNSDGTITTALIPNRALDRPGSMSGTEAPEGNISASIGQLYINTNTRELFIKKTPDGNIGWSNITPQKIEQYKESFIIQSDTTNVSLSHTPYNKDAVDVYVNGMHLSSDEYDLDTDGYTIILNEQYHDDSKVQVVYTTGLYGIKGDTALTVKVGDVNTVEHNVPARVENVGTNEDLILDFDIPKGKTGDSGVWVGSEEPTNEEKVVWIDLDGAGVSNNDLGVSRILDSGYSTDKNAYRKASKIMHSTVNETKCTKKNVTIDDNGQLRAEHIKGAGLTTNFDVKLLEKATAWSIEGRDYLDTSLGTHQFFFNIGGEDNPQLAFFFRSSSKTFVLRERYKTSKGKDIIEVNAEFNKNGKGWYKWKVEYANGAYELSVAPDNQSLKTYSHIAYQPITFPADKEYTLDISAEDSKELYSSMVADLTVFTIKIENQTAWSFNNVEYVTIFDNNFTTVGTPTFTNKGELTCVSNGLHYIYGDVRAQDLIGHSWRIEGHFNYTGISEVLWQFTNPLKIVQSDIDVDAYAGDYRMMSTSIKSDTNVLAFHLRTGNVKAHSNQHDFTFVIEKGKDYYYRYAYSNVTQSYTFTISENKDFTNAQNKNYSPYESDKYSYVCNVHPDYQITIGSSNTIENVSLDINNNLNFFKIYVDNKLVYRPLFIIPCTIGRNGAKFAYSEYKQLVQEAYNLYGVGDIFVIDEDKEAVQLPLTDIYSLMNDNKINVGKGLNYDKDTQTISNLVQGNELGDVGAALVVNEAEGTRKILNGQTLYITNRYLPFYEYVKSLDSSMRVTEDEWQTELTANQYCNKFVVSERTSQSDITYYAFVPDNYVTRTAHIEDTTTEDESTEDFKGLSVGTIKYSNGTVLVEEDGQLKWVTITKDNVSPDEWTEYQDYLESIAEEDDGNIKYDIVVGNYELSELRFTTSLNKLDNPRVYKLNNDILEVDTEFTIRDLLDDTQFYRLEKEDKVEQVDTVKANYIRLPKLKQTEGLRYYMVVATAVHDKVEIENTYQHNSPYSFGMYQYSDIALDNAGWLASEGQWNSADVYPSYYKWLVTQAEAQKDKFKIWNDANYTVTVYDFVVNREDRTFRLPIKTSYQDAHNCLHKRYLVDSDAGTQNWYNYYSDGWLEQGGKMVTAGSTEGASKTITFQKPFLDANYTVTLASGIGSSGWQYSNGASVGSTAVGSMVIGMATGAGDRHLSWKVEGYSTVPSDGLLHNAGTLYFYVGDVVQNAGLIKIDELRSDIAKLQDYIFYPPSNTYTDLGTPANNSIVEMPGNGWVTMRRTATGATQYLGMWDEVTGLGTLHWIPAKDNWAVAKLEVYKGMKVHVQYTAPTLNYFRFIPARRPE